VVASLMVNGRVFVPVSFLSHVIHGRVNPLLIVHVVVLLMVVVDTACHTITLPLTLGMR